MAVFGLASCSESNDEVDEFADWQTKNETYFNNIYQQAQQNIAAGNTSWKIIKNWSLPEYNAAYTASATDNIVVQVLQSGDQTSATPMYSDSVRVNYVGRFIPTPSYSQGMIFDRSYTGELDPATALPTGFWVSGVVDGFATALQQMHIGDRWLVYIPYQLGYGDTQSSTSSIPAYSTLIFDINLVSFYRPGQK